MALAVIAAAACEDTDGSAPAAQHGAGTGGSAAAGSGAAGAADSGAAAGTTAGAGAAGMAGMGGESGSTCAARHPTFFPDASGAPAAIRMKGTGSGVLSLDEKTSEGWSVSLLSGDLTPPSVLIDGGLLSNLMVGDQIEVTARESCQAFSGCKSFVVVRNAKDHALITADFWDDPSNLAPFGELLGVRFDLEPVCAFAPVSKCYENEVQTLFRLLVEADDTVPIDQHANLPMSIQGRPYTVWIGVAYTNTASGPPILDTCLDAAGFWWPGAVTLTITP